MQIWILPEMKQGSYSATDDTRLQISADPLNKSLDTTLEPSTDQHSKNDETVSLTTATTRDDS